MEASSNREVQRTVSAVAVALLTAIVLATQIWAALALLEPVYRPGVVTDPIGPDRFRVRTVVPESPAARAGLRPGDVLVFDTLRDRDRFLLGRRDAVAVSQTVERNGVHQSIELAASPATITPVWPDRALNLLAIAVAMVAVSVAGMVVFKDPGAMSWSLWIGMLGLCWSVTTQYKIFPPPASLAAFVVFTAAFTNVALWALPRFALRFPDDRLQPQSRLVDRVFLAALAFVWLATLLFYALEAFAPWFPLSARPKFYQWSMISSVVPVAATLAIVIGRLRAARGEQRARLRWATLGIVVSSISYAANIAFYGIGAGNAAPAFIEAAYVLAVPALALPCAVLYALGREQIIDARVIVNRTAIYALLTALLVGAIALIDWGVGRALSGSRLTLAVEAAITVALGATLNVVHGRIEELVEGVVFARRRAAERYLHRLAATLSIASTERTIEHAITFEVCDALAIASGAVFRRDAERGPFVRTAGVGWEDGMLHELEPEDELVRFLLTERSPVHVPEVRWRRRDVPAGTGAPAYALPIVVRGEVTGIAIFGSHFDRTALDREELAILERFVDRAGAALDLVAAAVLRRELAAFRMLYGPGHSMQVAKPTSVDV